MHYALCKNDDKFIKSDNISVTANVPVMGRNQLMYQSGSIFLRNRNRNHFFSFLFLFHLNWLFTFLLVNPYFSKTFTYFREMIWFCYIAWRDDLICSAVEREQFTKDHRLPTWWMWWIPQVWGKPNRWGDSYEVLWRGLYVQLLKCVELKCN